MKKILILMSCMCFLLINILSPVIAYADEIVNVEEFGFPFCVGSAGVENGSFGYTIAETTKKYTIEVVA